MYKITNLTANAFNGCTNLSKVVIGSTVSLVRSGAFSQCEELKDVYCYAENVPKAAGDAFLGSYIQYAQLHVPASSVNAYKEANVWKDFGTIIALTDDDLKPTDVNTLKDDHNDYPVNTYTIEGRLISNSQRGLNIIRMSDGTTKKVLLK